MELDSKIITTTINYTALITSNSKNQSITSDELERLELLYAIFLFDIWSNKFLTEEINYYQDYYVGELVDRIINKVITKKGATYYIGSVSFSSLYEALGQIYNLLITNNYEVKNNFIVFDINGELVEIPKSKLIKLIKDLSINWNKFNKTTVYKRTYLINLNNEEQPKNDCFVEIVDRPKNGFRTKEYIECLELIVRKYIHELETNKISVNEFLSKNQAILEKYNIDLRIKMLDERGLNKNNPIISKYTGYENFTTLDSVMPHLLSNHLDLVSVLNLHLDYIKELSMDSELLIEDMVDYPFNMDSSRVSLGDKINLSSMIACSYIIYKLVLNSMLTENFDYSRFDFSQFAPGFLLVLEPFNDPEATLNQLEEELKIAVSNYEHTKMIHENYLKDNGLNLVYHSQDTLDIMQENKKKAQEKHDQVLGKYIAFKQKTDLMTPEYSYKKSFIYQLLQAFVHENIYIKEKNNNLLLCFNNKINEEVVFDLETDLKSFISLFKLENLNEIRSGENKKRGSL